MPDFQRGDDPPCAGGGRSSRPRPPGARFPDWWEGTGRVEGERGEVTRYTTEVPDFAYPTAVTRPPTDGHDLVP